MCGWMEKLFFMKRNMKTKWIMSKGPFNWLPPQSDWTFHETTHIQTHLLRFDYFVGFKLLVYVNSFSTFSSEIWVFLHLFLFKMVRSFEQFHVHCCRHVYSMKISTITNNPFATENVNVCSTNIVTVTVTVTGAVHVMHFPLASFNFSVSLVRCLGYFIPNKKWYCFMYIIRDRIALWFYIF